MSDETDMVEVYRIIDANLNRLREGLRAVEEQARFLWNHKGLTERTKEVRHTVKLLVDQYIPRDALLQNRASSGDVGQNIDSVSEHTRDSVGDILVSNIKRAQESARVLEEYSKLLDANLALGFKNVRFELYDLEQAYFKVQSLDFKIYLLASGPEGVAEAIKGGVDLVQFRDKDSDDAGKLAKIRELKQICQAKNVPLMINDRPDLCVLTSAAGVHLGQDDVPIPDARKVVGPGRIVGFSTHSLDQAMAADEAGADYIAIGPVFPTESKGIPVEPIGLDIVREVLMRVSSPVVAIGGINSDNIVDVLETGVRRVAVIGAILGEGNPRDNAERLKDKINRFRKKDRKIDGGEK